MPHANMLRAHRKKWALTQTHVAHLIGHRARSVVSSYELGRSIPSLKRAIAYQFLFGERLEALFPGMSKEVEEEVVRRAVTLDRQIRGRNDASAKRLVELLSDLVIRADDSTVL